MTLSFVSSDCRKTTRTARRPVGRPVSRGRNAPRARRSGCREPGRDVGGRDREAADRSGGDRGHGGDTHRTRVDVHVAAEVPARSRRRGTALADHGGGETICVVSDHFSREEHVVEAPFDGFLAGILANPRVLPGHPLVHLVETDPEDREMIRHAFRDVGFARHGTFHWMGEMGDRLADPLLADPGAED